MVDVFSVIVFLLFAVVGMRIGFLGSLESAIALILAYTGSFYILQPILSLLSRFGLRENLFMPIAIFVFLLIVSWALIYSLAAPIFRKIDNKIPKWLGLFSGLIMAVVFCNITYIVLFGVFGEERVNQNSKICSVFVSKDILNIFKMKPFIYRDEALDGKTIVTEEETEIITVKNLPNAASASQSLQQEMLSDINKDRVGNNLVPLELDENLSGLALAYANEILETKRFSHYDQNLLMPEDRAKKAGIIFDYYGENLAIAPNLTDAYNGLFSSELHKENLLQPLFRRVGIAVLRLSDTSGVLVVQEFSN